MNESEVESLEVRLLLQAVSERYGYDFRGYSPDTMRRRVKSALAKSSARSLGELQHQLLRDPDVFAFVLDELTVHVTALFRDPSFYRALREKVLPLLRAQPSIKIWHAGCSTGEEVYAMAVLLWEEGLFERTQIYATDLSATALARAKEGTYPTAAGDAFRKNHELSGATAPLSNHVVEAYDGLAFNDELKRNILFFQHNLVSDHPFGEMNVVLCRNVLIYFGRPLRQHVLHTLRHSLCRGGFLCLGSSERLGREELRGRFTEFALSERIYRYEGSA